VVDVQKQIKKKAKKWQQFAVDDDNEDDENDAIDHMNKERLVKDTESVSSSTVAAVSTTISGKAKMGKKAKRFEKDEKREKEVQAKLLQSRILSEQQKQKEQQLQQLQQLQAENNDDEDADLALLEASLRCSDNTLVSIARPLAQDNGSAGVVFSSASANAVAPMDKVQSCNTCGGAFPDSKAYRDHFKYVYLVRLFSFDRCHVAFARSHEMLFGLS
jgi:hypothetical protein